MITLKKMWKRMNMRLIMSMDDEKEEEQCKNMNMKPSDTHNNNFPHAYFLLKYV